MQTSFFIRIKAIFFKLFNICQSKLLLPLAYSMYYKIKNIVLLSLLLCLGCAFSLHAQEAGSISGLVLEKGTSTRISDVNVNNLKNGQSARTNAYGVFTIFAAVGDTLSVNKVGYGPVKTVVRTLEDILVDLQSGLTIETVVVTRTSKEAELRGYLDEYRKKGVYNNGQNKFGTYLASPATALYNLFGQEAKNAKRFEKYMHQEVEATKVDRIFNKTLVTQLTKLEGEELQSFMDLYRPSYSTAQYWGQYDIMSYITRSFKSWDEQGRPKSQRLPKLEIPEQQK